MRQTFKVGGDTPLVGSIAFGLIDRGTNVIQVRPSTACPLSCVFCSTDAGPKSRNRQTEYLVELECLVDWFKRIVSFKGGRNIEAHIDTVGDPLTYPKIVELVQILSQIEGVSVVSMQNRGYLLSERLAEELSEAGLSRMNLSIDSLDPELARRLADTPTYNVDRVIGLAEHIVKNTRMDLLIAPVWVPGINDLEIPKIVEFALRIGAGKCWPPLGIQKFEFHKRGRKPPRVRPQSWSEFYQKLRRLEEKYRVKLIISRRDFEVTDRPMLPVPYKVGQKLRVLAVGPGWLRGETLAITKDKLRCLTVVGLKEQPPPGSELIVKIIRNKHNILLAEPA